MINWEKEIKQINEALNELGYKVTDYDQLDGEVTFTVSKPEQEVEAD